MSDPTPSSPPRVAPRKKASRAERVFAKLRAGMALWDIARRENCSVRTVRRIVADSLARLEIDPTAGYAQLQIARLNDALLVAHDKMLEGDLQALDRVLKVIESQDRYHGFGSIVGAAPVEADRARLTGPRPTATPGQARRDARAGGAHRRRPDRVRRRDERGQKPGRKVLKTIDSRPKIGGAAPGRRNGRSGRPRDEAEAPSPLALTSSNTAPAAPNPPRRACRSRPASGASRDRAASAG